MYNDSFADMMLNERKLTEKMKILLYFKKKHNCFFDNTVIFKTEICRMFLEHSKPDVDNNFSANSVFIVCVQKECYFHLQKKTKELIYMMVQNILQTLGFDEKVL